MMAEQQIKNNDNNREEALEMITAAMSVIVQIMDLSISAEIMAEAGEKYGREFIEGLLHELTEASIMFDVRLISRDIFLKRAILSMTRALPITWMQTRN
jgi:hypothetical protein|tara:strand:+ start:141 stop:437 length:297 start_codon:yes stop_codon:yes gene_type:complete